MRKISLLTVLLTCGMSMFNYPAFANKVIMPPKAEIKEILKNICGQNNIVEKENIPGENRLGCKASAVSEETYTSIKNISFTVEGVIYGSFTKQGIREALIDVEVDRSIRSHFYGGSMLLRHSNKGWSFVWYKSGARLHDCLKIPFKNNQSNFICRYQYYSAGSHSEWLTVVDFENKEENTTLLAISNNLGNCKSPFRDIKAINFAGKDINKDGLTDITINVRAGISNAKKIPESQCDEENGKLPNSKIYQLVFLSNGKVFKPTKQTVKIIKYFDYLMKTYVSK
jgi:hypothetical protein